MHISFSRCFAQEMANFGFSISKALVTEAGKRLEARRVRIEAPCGSCGGRMGGVWFRGWFGTVEETNPLLVVFRI